MKRIKLLAGTEAERMVTIRGRTDPPVGVRRLDDLDRLRRAIEHRERGLNVVLDGMILDALAVRLHPGDLATAWSVSRGFTLIELHKSALVAPGAFVWAPTRFVARCSVVPEIKRSGTSEPLHIPKPLTREELRRIFLGVR